ncbi:hypothetical protein ACFWBR_36910 [Streptomyces sp. NPDC060006]|uniref:hypothetical protein n=1 Tax=unclassified Streptomyces TaxID=2593676 RepID=UPI003679B673
MSGHTVRKAVATLTAALTLAAAGVLGSAGTASAASCYGGESYFSSDNHYFPESSSGRFTTTSRCGDINVRIINNIVTPSRKVKVCFYPSSRPSYCQSNYTTVYGGSWAVVADDVLDGTKFRLRFEDNWVQGYVAA